MLFVLLLLQACASVPTVLTEVELREVEVAVRTPLPDDCFAQHSVGSTSTLPAEGSLLFKAYTIWADALVTILKRYQAQTDRCRNLNEGHDPAAPIVEP